MTAMGPTAVVVTIVPMMPIVATGAPVPVNPFRVTGWNEDRACDDRWRAGHDNAGRTNGRWRYHNQRTRCRDARHHDDRWRAGLGQDHDRQRRQRDRESKRNIDRETGTRRSGHTEGDSNHRHTEEHFSFHSCDVRRKCARTLHKLAIDRIWTRRSAFNETWLADPEDYQCRS
jgi:hypothetical protein